MLYAFTLFPLLAFMIAGEFCGFVYLGFEMSDIEFCDSPLDAASLLRLRSRPHAVATPARLVEWSPQARLMIEMSPSTSLGGIDRVRYVEFGGRYVGFPNAYHLGDGSSEMLLDHVTLSRAVRPTDCPAVNTSTWNAADGIDTVAVIANAWRVLLQRRGRSAREVGIPVGPIPNVFTASDSVLQRLRALGAAVTRRRVVSTVDPLIFYHHIADLWMTRDGRVRTIINAQSWSMPDKSGMRYSISTSDTIWYTPPSAQRQRAQ